MAGLILAALIPIATARAHGTLDQINACPCPGITETINDPSITLFQTFTAGQTSLSGVDVQLGHSQASPVTLDVKVEILDGTTFALLGSVTQVGSFWPPPPRASIST